MPPPAISDSTRSRRRRALARASKLSLVRIFLSRLGSQRRPSKISTVVATSTTNCVKARSGAENHRKVRIMHRPVPPSMISAVIRWYLAFQAVPRAQRQPIVHSRMKADETGSTPRLPSCMPRIHSGSTAATRVIQVSHSICHCQRRVDRARRPARPSKVSRASRFSKMLRPLTRPNTGVVSKLPELRCQRSSTYSTMPPASATKLIISGIFQPCQIARLYSGRSPPTTGVAAAARKPPMAQAGKMPTIRQASTSSSTGTRIQCGGS